MSSGKPIDVSDKPATSVYCDAEANMSEVGAYQLRFMVSHTKTA